MEKTFINNFNPSWINFINTLTKNEECRKEASRLLKINEETSKEFFQNLKAEAIITIAIAKHNNGELVEFTTNQHKKLNGKIDTLYSIIVYGSDGRKFKFHLKQVEILKKVLGEPAESTMTQEKEITNKLTGAFVPRWNNFDWLFQSINLLEKANEKKILISLKDFIKHEWLYDGAIDFGIYALSPTWTGRVQDYSKYFSSDNPDDWDYGRGCDYFSFSIYDIENNKWVEDGFVLANGDARHGDEEEDNSSEFDYSESNRLIENIYKTL